MTSNTRGTVYELMTDKSFYTIIRRFRYQYKKFQAINDLNREYWDKNIRDAYKKAEDDLVDTTNRIILMVFGMFINPNNTSLEFNQDAFYEPSFFGKMARCMVADRHFDVTVDNEEFYKFVDEVLRLYWRE